MVQRHTGPPALSQTPVGLARTSGSEPGVLGEGETQPGAPGSPQVGSPLPLAHSRLHSMGSSSSGLSDTPSSGPGQACLLGSLRGRRKLQMKEGRKRLHRKPVARTKGQSPEEGTLDSQSAVIDSLRSSSPISAHGK